MNKRIKQLIDKMDTSGLQYQSDDCEMTVTHRDLEYFAKLIVRECAELTRWKEFDMSVEQRIRLSVYQDIKEHFGVEE
jgi:hypothetical protein